MEKLSNNIALKMSSNLKLNKDQQEVIAYGVFSFIQTIWCISLVLLFGSMFNVLIESFLISLVIAILKRKSGGPHASSPNRCAIIGACIAVGLALLIKYSMTYINLEISIIIGIVSFILAYYIIYKYAPVDSSEKPIVKETTKEKLKKKSLFLLNLFFTISIILYIIYLTFKIKFLLSIIFCIYIGILWQVLTLTPKGYIILLKIDIYLKNFIEILKGKKSNEE